jgi:hypothetical protein
MRPNAEFPLLFACPKGFFPVSINQFRDGARISDRLVENMIQNISRSWTSKLLAN